MTVGDFSKLSPKCDPDKLLAWPQTKQWGRPLNVAVAPMERAPFIDFYAEPHWGNVDFNSPVALGETACPTEGVFRRVTGR